MVKQSFFKRYGLTIFLLAGLLIGGISGLVIGPKAAVVKPFGDLFLNLMFMILIPLVFFSISSAIANMEGMKRLGKIMGATFLVFIFTAFVAAIISYIGIRIVTPIKGADIGAVKELMGVPKGAGENVSVLEKIVEMFTVDDFSGLLTKQHMLPLIFFSVLIGIATSMLGEKAKAFRDLLNAGSEVMMKFVNLIMYYAPFGLACYFATVIGQLGSQIATGYLRTFVLYIVLAAIYFFVFYSLYAFMAGGKAGVKIFWRNMAEPAVTALATSSSAACIPVNLQATKKMGVSSDIAETVIPLGANTHKDGSVIGGMMKIAFLYTLFGYDITSPKSIALLILGAFLVGAVMGSIPIGGMVAEATLITAFNFPLEALPLIMIISTIIDVPATLLNSSGNTVSAMMINRLVEGKNWLKEKV